ncbi:MAG: DNA primase [Ruminiclostridium sp.]|uniref:CHC2 zinc finger domain-containing protein n=1 Tax=Ruminococcus sp. TaxID=41978 RepID=UPI0025FB48C0|nr:CHC2 zinc finger domain-containing protein [Ruminococcus sp.]MBR1432566.1 DNA primase [Ruminococcus sp.]MBR1832652.1 DNA primase [Ruminiclostridium sp.]
MIDFEQIRQLVDIRQAAEMYGLEVNRAGMARCIFHGDRNPSMKMYDDHFHCYACGAHGDVTDLTAQMFGLTKNEAADKLCADFGISGSSPPMIAPKRKRILSGRERVQRAFDVLTDYIVMLREFRVMYAPTDQGEPLDSRFILSLQQLDYAEYLWDELLDSTENERAEFISANIPQFRRYYDSLKMYGHLRPSMQKTHTERTENYGRKAG